MFRAGLFRKARAAQHGPAGQGVPRVPRGQLNSVAAGCVETGGGSGTARAASLHTSAYQEQARMGMPASSADQGRPIKHMPEAMHGATRKGEAVAGNHHVNSGVLASNQGHGHALKANQAAMAGRPLGSAGRGSAHVVVSGSAGADSSGGGAVDDVRSMAAAAGQPVDGEHVTAQAPAAPQRRNRQQLPEYPPVGKATRKHLFNLDRRMQRKVNQEQLRQARAAISQARALGWEGPGTFNAGASRAVPVAESGHHFQGAREDGFCPGEANGHGIHDISQLGLPTVTTEFNATAGGAASGIGSPSSSLAAPGHERLASRLFVPAGYHPQQHHQQHRMVGTASVTSSSTQGYTSHQPGMPAGPSGEGLVDEVQALIQERHSPRPVVPETCSGSIAHSEGATASSNASGGQFFPEVEEHVVWQGAGVFPREASAAAAAATLQSSEPASIKSMMMGTAAAAGASSRRSPMEPSYEAGMRSRLDAAAPGRESLAEPEDASEARADQSQVLGAETNAPADMGGIELEATEERRYNIDEDRVEIVYGRAADMDWEGAQPRMGAAQAQEEAEVPLAHQSSFALRPPTPSKSEVLQERMAVMDWEGSQPPPVSASMAAVDPQASFAIPSTRINAYDDEDKETTMARRARAAAPPTPMQSGVPSANNQQQLSFLGQGVDANAFSRHLQSQSSRKARQSAKKAYKAGLASQDGTGTQSSSTGQLKGDDVVGYGGAGASSGFKGSPTPGAQPADVRPRAASDDDGLAALEALAREQLLSVQEERSIMLEDARYESVIAAPPPAKGTPHDVMAPSAATASSASLAPRATNGSRGFGTSGPGIASSAGIDAVGGILNAHTSMTVPYQPEERFTGGSAGEDGTASSHLKPPQFVSRQERDAVDSGAGDDALQHPEGHDMASIVAQQSRVHVTNPFVAHPQGMPLRDDDTVMRASHEPLARRVPKSDAEAHQKWAEDVPSPSSAPIQQGADTVTGGDEDASASAHEHPEARDHMARSSFEHSSYGKKPIRYADTAERSGLPVIQDRYAGSEFGSKLVQRGGKAVIVQADVHQDGVSREHGREISPPSIATMRDAMAAMSAEDTAGGPDRPKQFKPGPHQHPEARDFMATSRPDRHTSYGKHPQRYEESRTASQNLRAPEPQDRFGGSEFGSKLVQRPGEGARIVQADAHTGSRSETWASSHAGRRLATQAGTSDQANLGPESNFAIPSTRIHDNAEAGETAATASASTAEDRQRQQQADETAASMDTVGEDVGGHAVTHESHMWPGGDAVRGGQQQQQQQPADVRGEGRTHREYMDRSSARLAGGSQAVISKEPVPSIIEGLKQRIPSNVGSGPLSAAADRIGHQVEDTVHRIEEKVESAAHTAENVVKEQWHRAGETVQWAYESPGELAEKARLQVARATAAAKEVAPELVDRAKTGAQTVSNIVTEQMDRTETGHKIHEAVKPVTDTMSQAAVAAKAAGQESIATNDPGLRSTKQHLKQAGSAAATLLLSVGQAANVGADVVWQAVKAATVTVTDRAAPTVISKAEQASAAAALKAQQLKESVKHGGAPMDVRYSDAGAGVIGSSAGAAAAMSAAGLADRLVKQPEPGIYAETETLASDVEPEINPIMADTTEAAATAAQASRRDASRLADDVIRSPVPGIYAETESMTAEEAEALAQGPLVQPSSTAEGRQSQLGDRLVRQPEPGFYPETVSFASDVEPEINPSMVQDVRTTTTATGATASTANPAGYSAASNPSVRFNPSADPTAELMRRGGSGASASRHPPSAAPQSRPLSTSALTAAPASASMSAAPGSLHREHNAADASVGQRIASAINNLPIINTIQSRRREKALHKMDLSDQGVPADQIEQYQVGGIYHDDAAAVAQAVVGADGHVAVRPIPAAATNQAQPLWSVRSGPRMPSTRYMSTLASSGASEYGAPPPNVIAQQAQREKQQLLQQQQESQQRYGSGDDASRSLQVDSIDQLAAEALAGAGHEGHHAIHRPIERWADAAVAGQETAVFDVEETQEATASSTGAAARQHFPPSAASARAGSSPSAPSQPGSARGMHSSSTANQSGFHGAAGKDGQAGTSTTSGRSINSTRAQTAAIAADADEELQYEDSIGSEVFVQAPLYGYLSDMAIKGQAAPELSQKQQQPDDVRSSSRDPSPSSRSTPAAKIGAEEAVMPDEHAGTSVAGVTAGGSTPYSSYVVPPTASALFESNPASHHGPAQHAHPFTATTHIMGDRPGEGDFVALWPWPDPGPAGEAGPGFKPRQQHVAQQPHDAVPQPSLDTATSTGTHGQPRSMNTPIEDDDVLVPAAETAGEGGGGVGRWSNSHQPKADSMAQPSRGFATSAGIGASTTSSGGTGAGDDITSGIPPYTLNYGAGPDPAGAEEEALAGGKHHSVLRSIGNVAQPDPAARTGVAVDHEADVSHTPEFIEVQADEEAVASGGLSASDVYRQAKRKQTHQPRPGEGEQRRGYHASTAAWLAGDKEGKKVVSTNTADLWQDGGLSGADDQHDDAPTLQMLGATGDVDQNIPVPAPESVRPGQPALATSSAVQSPPSIYQMVGEGGGMADEGAGESRIPDPCGQHDHPNSGKIAPSTSPSPPSGYASYTTTASAPTAGASSGTAVETMAASTSIDPAVDVNEFGGSGRRAGGGLGTDTFATRSRSAAASPVVRVRPGGTLSVGMAPWYSSNSRYGAPHASTAAASRPLVSSTQPLSMPGGRSFEMAVERGWRAGDAGSLRGKDITNAFPSGAHPMTEEPDHTMRMVPDPTQGGRLVWKWRAEPNEQAADRRSVVVDVPYHGAAPGFVSQNPRILMNHQQEARNTAAKVARAVLTAADQMPENEKKRVMRLFNKNAPGAEQTWRRFAGLTGLYRGSGVGIGTAEMGDPSSVRAHRLAGINEVAEDEEGDEWDEVWDDAAGPLSAGDAARSGKAARQGASQQQPMDVRGVAPVTDQAPIDVKQQQMAGSVSRVSASQRILGSGESAEKEGGARSYHTTARCFQQGPSAGAGGDAASGGSVSFADQMEVMQATDDIEYQSAGTVGQATLDRSDAASPAVTSDAEAAINAELASYEDGGRGEMASHEPQHIGSVTMASSPQQNQQPQWISQQWNDDSAVDQALGLASQNSDRVMRWQRKRSLGPPEACGWDDLTSADLRDLMDTDQMGAAAGRTAIYPASVGDSGVDTWGTEPYSSPHQQQHQQQHRSAFYSTTASSMQGGGAGATGRAAGRGLMDWSGRSTGGLDYGSSAFNAEGANSSSASEPVQQGRVFAFTGIGTDHAQQQQRQEGRVCPPGSYPNQEGECCPMPGTDAEESPARIALDKLVAGNEDARRRADMASSAEGGSEFEISRDETVIPVDTAAGAAMAAARSTSAYGPDETARLVDMPPQDVRMKTYKDGSAAVSGSTTGNVTGKKPGRRGASRSYSTTSAASAARSSSNTAASTAASSTHDGERPQIRAAQQQHGSKAGFSDIGMKTYMNVSSGQSRMQPGKAAAMDQAQQVVLGDEASEAIAAPVMEAEEMAQQNQQLKKSLKRTGKQGTSADKAAGSLETAPSTGSSFDDRTTPASVQDLKQEADTDLHENAQANKKSSKAASVSRISNKKKQPSLPSEARGLHTSIVASDQSAGAGSTDRSVAGGGASYGDTPDQLAAAQQQQQEAGSTAERQPEYRAPVDAQQEGTQAQPWYASAAEVDDASIPESALKNAIDEVPAGQGVEQAMDQQTQGPDFRPPDVRANVTPGFEVPSPDKAMDDSEADSEHRILTGAAKARRGLKDSDKPFKDYPPRGSLEGTVRVSEVQSGAAGARSGMSTTQRRPVNDTPQDQSSG